MPKDVSKFSGFSSVFSVVLAILVGVVFGSILAYAAIVMLWGAAAIDLWPLGVG